MFVNKKQLINQCNKLGDHFIKEGIQFKNLALSLKENKCTVNIKDFINKRYNKFIELEV